MIPARAKVVFQDALELPESERASHLDAVCGSDAELRRRVEELLAAHEADHEVLDAEPRFHLARRLPRR